MMLVNFNGVLYFVDGFFLVNVMLSVEFIVVGFVWM